MNAFNNTRMLVKRNSGYHQRYLAEAAMYRLKTIFGSHVRGRLFETQATELLLCCAALNKMAQLGMPGSIKIAN